MPLIVLLAAQATVACNQDDTGKLCGEPNVTVPSQPVEGEVPVVGEVNITRDPNCLTFKCLTQGGLPSYCTKTCNINIPSDKVVCVTDNDCQTRPHIFGPGYHCTLATDGNNYCVNDNCPAGFWCNPVVNVGPYQGQYFCQRQTGCTADVDCNAPGSYACEPWGCFGSCLYNPTTCGNGPNQLECQSDYAIGCNCNNANDVKTLLQCTSSALTCTPPGVNTFPTGSVTPLNVCLPTN